MISIVIPLYNKEKQIADTLKSVFAQTYQDFEVVIVNDGSTDGSVDAVRRIDDPRIRLISQTNAGVSVARNRGIAEARGEYIALLDADDEWKPEYLAAQIHLAEKYTECGVFVTDYQFRDEHGTVTPTRINNIPFQGESGVISNYFEVAATSNPPICSINIMTRKAAFDAVGGFPVGIKSGEDLLTWARLAARFKIAYCRKPLAVYYTPTTGSTGEVPVDLATTRDAVGEQLSILMRQFPNQGIEVYISFWYKMRAVINLHFRNRNAAMRCALKAIRYNPKNFKAWIIAGISYMPGVVINKILNR